MKIVIAGAGIGGLTAAAALLKKGFDVTVFEQAQALKGETCEGDLLIGADGVHSRVRHALFGPDEPVFSGVMAWRGVIDASKLPEHLRSPYGANWVGPGAHVIHYPLRGNGLVNFVG